ncbi:hypothetical protein OPV22_016388 [Ensete ventricosum]|uniref:Uncharacterized protein n=1 Tax=Ensete ventricosum TaxID=4639 RepID=A0AAV8QZU2_ENSVE|nr:hypothetical protein OPV22_016388 [Ensete ventricosum]
MPAAYDGRVFEKDGSVEWHHVDGFLPLSFLTVLELKIVSGMKPKSTEGGNSREKDGGRRNTPQKKRSGLLESCDPKAWLWSAVE